MMDGFRASPRSHTAGCHAGRHAGHARPAVRALHALRAGAAACVLVIAGAALAQADATIDQVYQAAREGHLAQAQQMMGTVLRDHPNSAKAHYVEAELLARLGQLTQARAEFHTAEQLAPGLPFARAEAVQALQRELAAPSPRSFAAPWAGGHWSIAAALAAGALLAWLLARLGRPQPTTLPAPPAAWQGSWNGGPAPSAPQAPAAGLGRQIAGGLATGLAAGAGVVAAEAIAHRLLDGAPAVETGALPTPQDEPRADLPDTDTRFGGTDFGIDDPGSWDASSDASAGDWDT